MALDRFSEVDLALPYLSNEQLNKIILRATEIKRERRIAEFRKLKDRESMA